MSDAQRVKESGESECRFVMNRIEPMLVPKGSQLPDGPQRSIRVKELNNRER